jgi:hypothetical protein
MEENRVLGCILGPMKEEVIRDEKIAHRELHKCYS